jgi:hypothetical protein
VSACCSARPRDVERAPLGSLPNIKPCGLALQSGPKGMRIGLHAGCGKEIRMSVNFVSFTMHDGKSVIKINPTRVNYLISTEIGYTKIHFGLDQNVDVIGDLADVEAVLSSS